MALIIKHAFVSPKLDGPDPTIVRPTNWNEPHVITGSGWMIPGQVIDYLGHTIPSYLLEAYGQSVAALTFPLLFQAMVKQDTVTLTTGSPGTVNWTGHGLPVNSKIRFHTTGALPTGISVDVDYFVISASYGANSFRIATTLGGTAINLSGTQSGVHTGINAQFGVSNDLATFTVPDLRGRVTAGLDSMGGTSANRITGTFGGINGDSLGAVGGAESHTLAISELPAHQHNNNPPDPTVSIAGLTVTVNSGGAHTHTVNTSTGLTGSAGAHTPSGTVGSEAAHTHSINPPATDTTAGGAGSAHTHTIPVLSGTTGAGSAHSHGVGTIDGTADSGGSHAHTHSLSVSGAVTSGGIGLVGTADNFSGGGSKVGVIPTGGTGLAPDWGTHTHADSFAVAGSINSGGAHTHTLTMSGSTASESAHTHSVSTVASTTGSGGGGADHTHTVDIAAFTSAAGSSHTHSFTGDAVAAHTHTVTIDSVAAHTHTASASGTVTSAQADYLSDAAGGGGAHNNLQPMMMVRKLVYVG